MQKIFNRLIYGSLKTQMEKALDDFDLDKVIGLAREGQTFIR